MDQLDPRLEIIARTIDPTSWEAFDRAMAPWLENRGSYSNENFWYQATYQAGCRTAEDVKEWFQTKEMTGTEHVTVSMLRLSLGRAKAVLDNELIRVVTFEQIEGWLNLLQGAEGTLVGEFYKLLNGPEG